MRGLTRRRQLARARNRAEAARRFRGYASHYATPHGVVTLSVGRGVQRALEAGGPDADVHERHLAAAAVRYVDAVLAPRNAVRARSVTVQRLDAWGRPLGPPVTVPAYTELTLDGGSTLTPTPSALAPRSPHP